MVLISVIFQTDAKEFQLILIYRSDKSYLSFEFERFSQKKNVDFTDFLGTPTLD